MKICIIAADENRDRQRFISNPLLNGGHIVHVVRTRPFGGLLYHLFCLFFKDTPDVVVFMGTGPKELLALCIVNLFNVPFVVRLGGNALRDLRSVAKSYWNDRRYLRWLIYKFHAYITKIFLKKTEAVIVVNEALSKKIEKYIKVPHKIFVIPQYCDGEKKLKKYEINKPVKLLTVTNFLFSEKAEGVIWIINSLNRYILEYGESIHLCVAGGGQHLKDVEEYLCSYKKSDLLEVELLGFVDNLASHYSSTDIFVYRSFHDATPNVILESKRYGLPLLANNCIEFQTIVDHGNSGYLYKNENDFNLRLSKLIEDQSLREELGMNASKECEEKFSMEKIEKQIVTALSDLC